MNKRFIPAAKQCAALLTAAVMIFGTASIAFAADDSAEPETPSSSAAERPVAKKRDVSSSSEAKQPTAKKRTGSSSGKESKSAAADWEYGQLGGNARGVYRTLVDGLTAMKTSISVGSQVSSEDMNSIVELVKKNHPELFWISYDSVGISTQNGKSTWTFPVYSAFRSGGKLDTAAIKKVQESLSAVVKAVGRRENDYETAKAINDYLASNVKYSYDYSNYNVYEVTGSLAGSSSACEGFAKGFKYLCDKLGVECIVVAGKGILNGRTYDHAWNYVQLGGKWYLVDSTWNSLGSGKEKWFLLGSNSTVGGLTLLRSHAPYTPGDYPALSEADYAA